MKMTVEFTYNAGDPGDPMSTSDVDIKEVWLDDVPLTPRQECDVQLQTALRAAIYRLKAILPNEHD